MQKEVFTDLPNSVGFHGEPLWWPLPWLTLSGLLVALAIRFFPGTGGHEPSEGFKAGGPVPPMELFGIAAAAFATLSLGAVLGPEAPLIAIGSGLGVLAVHLFRRGTNPWRPSSSAVAGQLRRHRHAAGLSPRRRVPPHGDGGVGWSDDGDRAASRAAVGRGGCA